MLIANFNTLPKFFTSLVYYTKCIQYLSIHYVESNILVYYELNYTNLGVLCLFKIQPTRRLICTVHTDL